MSRSTLYITRLLPEPVMAALRERYTLVSEPGEHQIPTADDLRRGFAQADAVICTLADPITDELLAAAPRLKIVANYAVGYNNIDVAAAARRGIVLTNTPDVLTDATADLHRRAEQPDRAGHIEESLVQRQRLHVVFEIGRGLRVVAFDEGAELRGRHRQRAAAVHRVFEAHHQLAPQRMRHGVERFDVADLERHAQLQMVVQIGADTGQIVRDGNAVALQ